MGLKVAVGVLVLLLAAESSYIVIHRHSISRFKQFGDDDLIAFDTATGQICKTLRTKSVAQIERSETDTVSKRAPCPPLPSPSGDPVLDEINRLARSRRCGGNREDASQKLEANSTLEFIANLPACADIP